MEGWLTSRYRLITVVVALLLTGFTATSLISYSISRDAIRDSIIRNELPLSSHTIFSEIQADLLKPIFVSSLMAQDTFLRDWVLAGEQNPTDIQRYLEEIRKKYGTFTSYFISEKTLNYYHFSGISRQVNPSDPADRWFWDARSMPEDYVINLDNNKEQDARLTVYINHRVMDYSGNFIGVTGVGLGLDSVQKLVSQYQDNFRRTIYFVNEAGQVQLHSKHTRSGHDSILEQPGIRHIAHQVLSQDYGTFSYQRDGERILLTSRFLPELKWHLLVELREADAMEPIRNSLLMNLTIGILVIGLISLVIAHTISGFHQRMEHMATTDKLSGLGNRQYFDMMLGQALNQYQRSLQPFSLIVLDIDHFKQVNDQLGHSTGDQAIQALSQLIGGCIRRSDSLCRWGGEEFVILVPECSRDDARNLAEKIRQKTATSALLADHPERVITLSAGVTAVQQNDTASQLFSRADRALYRAKGNGRNRVDVG